MAQNKPREEADFNQGWKFYLGDNAQASNTSFADQSWRTLNLPHDWGIEGSFSKDHLATVGGGALPGGIGWYRKTFTVPALAKGKNIAIDFDGVYKNSEVWINGHLLGKRPNGYIAFRYDLSPYLKYGSKNTIAVRVDNSQQPNARWYTGSGIYRDVKLITTNTTHVEQWGTFVTTPVVSKTAATVKIEMNIKSPAKKTQQAVIKTLIFDKERKLVASATEPINLTGNTRLSEEIEVANPKLWSDKQPYLYTVETQILVNKVLVDAYHTTLGIRSFSFDAEQGFILNGEALKIRGVCNHHDLGALGTAFNVRAAERQLEILKSMGVNALRTAHNPPAAALLALCDKMGFIVMNEAFDMWAKKKSDFDYHLDWDKWHKKDLEDQILRDRNHPSVFIWSVGNEIQEQWGTGADTVGRVITRELAAIVKNLDTTRPITTANNDINVYNNLIKSGALDIIGYNYNHDKWKDFHKTYPGKKLIATETTSALQTRGHYDNPADSIRIWPTAWDKPLLTGNADFSCSAYDNCYTPWGSSHEQTLIASEYNPAVSGIFVWTGFDYLGEPTPYVWPARSSYFGIMDLAGFPKDVYYLYKSVWTDEAVLHVFPHWNWKAGQTVDVLAYFSQADEVELYLNGTSLGKKSKQGQDMKVSWKVKYAAGELKAVSRKKGNVVLEKVIHTAGPAAKLVLIADRSKLSADGKDLSFITVKVMDKDGNLIPDADHLINFSIAGDATLAAVDNGSPISHESFKANHRKAFNGLALAIIKSGMNSSTVKVTASSKGLVSGEITLEIK
ncbi:beta-galactosidase [Pedobacter sp. CAN_A7]|uniref:beta-galactosidase GalB n=1 Tax=Pedobacter sp. CAN_A7 TaxID=2787722 RepID=UPI0018C964E4